MDEKLRETGPDAPADGTEGSRPAPDFAKREGRRAGRGRIIAALIGLAAACSPFLFQPNLGNIFVAPEVITSAEQMEAAYLGRKYHVTARASAMFDTMYMERKNGRRDATYYAFAMGERFVIVRAGLEYDEPSYTDKDIQGRLEKPEGLLALAADRVAADISEQLGVDDASARAILAPYIIDTTVPRWADQAAWGAVFGLGCFWLFYLALGLGQVISPYECRDFRRMGRDAGVEPEDVNKAVSEVISASDGFAAGSWTFYPGWIIRRGAFDYRVWKLSGLVWAYIRGGSVWLRFENGGTASLKFRGAERARLVLAWIAARAPGVVTGYDAGMAEAFERSVAAFRADYGGQAPGSETVPEPAEYADSNKYDKNFS
ncbi:MAG: hypothetical protein LBK41_02375 [Clostridiales bacterium]|jgi:hypothetical protein|nr:hypothetical protein [Clostridiales bacterium]